MQQSSGWQTFSVVFGYNSGEELQFPGGFKIDKRNSGQERISDTPVFCD